MKVGHLYRQLRQQAHQHRLAVQWVKGGKREPPPHLIKEQIVRQYAERFSCEVLVETGTYHGDMVFALRKRFRRIISIELDRKLFEQAEQRFASYPHITIFHGDSAALLPSVLKSEEGRHLFWLDGHYSAGETAKGERETPIIEELHHIQSFRDDSVILIDDARLFVGKNDYPSLRDLESHVKRLLLEHHCEVRDDIIRLSPPLRGEPR